MDSQAPSIQTTSTDVRVVGFHHEPQWSDELAKLPETLADAHWQVARWQSKYGRDPTVQLEQRSWLVNKIRTDMAVMGTKLNVQVMIKIQEPPEHAREVTSAHGSAKEDGAGVPGLGPPTKHRTTHRRTQRPPSGVADVY